MSMNCPMDSCELREREQALQATVRYTVADSYGPFGKKLPLPLPGHLRRAELTVQRGSVAEVPHPGKDHGQTRFISSGNDLFVPDRATRLDHSRRARLCR